MNRDEASGRIPANRQRHPRNSCECLWFRILVFLQASDVLAAQHAERYATTGVEARCEIWVSAVVIVARIVSDDIKALDWIGVGVERLEISVNPDTIERAQQHAREFACVKRRLA